MAVHTRRRGAPNSRGDLASQGSHQWLDDHTRQLVEDITGLAGVQELVLTVREEAPARLTTDQVRHRNMSGSACRPNVCI